VASSVLANSDPDSDGTGRLAVLKHRQFRLVLVERLLSTSALGIETVALAFAVLGVTKSPAYPEGSASALSYVLAAQIAPMLVFTLLGGILADRFRPQRVMFASNLCGGIGAGAAGLLLLTHSAHVWSLLLCATLSGIGGAMFYPAAQALTPRLVSDQHFQVASSLSRLVQSSALMLGSAIGGVIVATAGSGWAMAAIGIILAGSTLPLLRIAVPAIERSAEHEPSMLDELREGWTEVRSRTWLWLIIALYAVVLAAWFGGFMLIGPIVAKEHLGGAPAWAAIVVADGVGLLLGGLAGLRWQPKRPMYVGMLLTFCFALPPLAMALAAPLTTIIGTSVVAGFAAEYCMILWTVTLGRHIPQDKLARVYSYDALGSLCATPLGYLVAGPLASAYGTRAVQLSAAVLIVGPTVVALRVREIRHLRSDAPMAWVA